MVNATDFDGSTDFFLRGGGLTGAADGSLGLLSMWLNPDTLDGTERVFASNTNRVEWRVETVGGSWGLVCQSAVGGTLVQFTSSTQIPLDDWSHILMAWDTADSVVAYLNDTRDTGLLATVTAGDIDYTASNWAVGARTLGSLKWDGCLSEVYLNFAETLDITITANRRKFISSKAEAVGLGSDGSKPTGSAPIVYLPNPAASFGTNAGTGGDFTDQGSVVVCADPPPPVVATGDYILPLMRRRQRRT